MMDRSSNEVLNKTKHNSIVEYQIQSAILFICCFPLIFDLIWILSIVYILGFCQYQIPYNPGSSNDTNWTGMMRSCLMDTRDSSRFDRQMSRNLMQPYPTNRGLPFCTSEGCHFGGGCSSRTKIEYLSITGPKKLVPKRWIRIHRSKELFRSEPETEGST